HHSPPCSTRPIRSLWPSPLRSSAWTSTQVAAVLQTGAPALLVNEVPSDSTTSQAPLVRLRPARSLRPSRLQSPACTLPQTAAGSGVFQARVGRPLRVDGATSHWPVWALRPAMLATGPAGGGAAGGATETSRTPTSSPKPALTWTLTR